MNESLVMKLESDLAFELIRHNEKFRDLQTYEDGRWLGRLDANTSHYLVGLILASPEMQAIRYALLEMALLICGEFMHDGTEDTLGRVFHVPQSVIDWVMVSP